jgi:GTP-binding protein
MFDKVGIEVRAGDGGNGVVSFRREKFVPFGGPDGGDGGDGGDVVVIADETVTSLKMLARKRFHRAGKGGDGGSKKKHGKKGKDLFLAVPVGTVVSYKSQIGDKALIADLEQPGQQAVLAKGGKGGFGNTHFATATNQAPKTAQKGEAGEENSIILELKLIADVGLIGYPNVGKSSLLAAVSAAKPRIASYPFTTREPELGVVEVGRLSFVLAEIPGLLDGAHLGRGLGHDFLRHIMRTRVLIHLVDGSSPSPVDDMIRVNTELGLFDSSLAKKPQLVAVNKMDLPQVRAQLDNIKDSFKSVGTKVLFVSAVTGEGTSELMAEATKLLGSAKPEAVKIKKVFQPKPRR